MVNCILAGEDNIGLAFEQAGPPRYTGDHSLFHDDNPDRAIVVGYADEYSLIDLATGQWAADSGQDEHSVIASQATQVFVSPERYALSLSRSSTALDAGRAEETPASDIAGAPRPQQNGVDIGAWELPQ